MLPTLPKAPFHRPGWVYEEKYDGNRMLAYQEGERVRLVSRQGRDWTFDFQDVANAIARVPTDTLLLDGEVVIFNAKLVSRFERAPGSDPRRS